MTWTCPKCNANEIDNATVRCTCGYEVEIKTEEVDYQKIGGALYLVLAGLVLSPLLNLGSLMDQTRNGLPKAPLELLVVSISFCFYIILPILMIVLLVNRKKILRPTIITFYILNLLGALFVYFAIKSMQPAEVSQDALTTSKSGVLVAIIGCAVWVTYFLKSERVKRTLTR